MALSVLELLKLRRLLLPAVLLVFFAYLLTLTLLGDIEFGICALGGCARGAGGFD